MNRKKHILVAILILLNILMSIALNLLYTKSYAAVTAKQTLSADINGIDDKKYPGIKKMIQDLQKKHSKWSFKVLYTGLKWNDVISGEYSGHGKSPSNLVPANNKSYAGDWICPICGNKVYDNGKWNCASEAAIKYMMDPRDSLNESDVFQFMQLTYTDCSYNDIQPMISSYSYLNKSSIINSILSIGKKYNISPYYIVARITQEQGSGKSVLATGKEYKGTDGVTYKGYYNFFNIKASGNSTAEIYTNALSYAKKQGWTTPEKSIEGGVELIGDAYIKYGQNTLYFQKFNVSSTSYSYYSHQYQQNILAAQNEGTTLRKTFNEMGHLDEKYTFIIPLYEQMPSSTCARPSTTTTKKYNTGDCNGDGSINSGDLLVVQKHLLKTQVVNNSAILESMDINKDNQINSGDLLLIKKHLLGTYKIK